MQTLDRSNPDLAKAFREAMPQPGPRLAAAMVAVGSAVRTGDSRAWPGDKALDALSKAGDKGKALAKRIGDDVKDLSRAQQGGGEWRPTPMPFVNGAEIEKIQLYVHRDPDEGEEDGQKKKGEDGVRFLIDLDLSRLGPMQLDGYAVEKDRRFDLVIRTEKPLEDEVRMGILRIFTRSLEALGVAGSAGFLVTSAFVRPQSGDRDKGPGVVV